MEISLTIFYILASSFVRRQEREQVRSDVEVLTDYSLVHETDGVYRLHDLTHEYLWLHTKMTPDTVSLAVSRQARFLVAPETLLTSAPGERKPKHGGRYRLVKLWAAVKKLDQSRSMWNEIVNLEEASTDKAYMKEVSMLMRMVVSKPSEHLRLAFCFVGIFLPRGSFASLTRTYRIDRVEQGEYAGSESILKRVLLQGAGDGDSTDESSILLDLGYSLVEQVRYCSLMEHCHKALED